MNYQRNGSYHVTLYVTFYAESKKRVVNCQRILDRCDKGCRSAGKIEIIGINRNIFSENGEIACSEGRGVVKGC